MTVVDVFEAVGSHAAGKLPIEDLCDLEKHACPGDGACGGQFTANTMACVSEAIGLALPLSSALPAPLDALSSFLNLEAALVRIKGTAVALGSATSSDNVLKATPVLSTLSVLQDEIVLLQAAVVAVGALAAAATPTGASPPLATAATTALNALNAAVPSTGASTLAACVANGPTLSIRMS